MIDFSKIKSDFPIFKKNPNLIYLDSTATSLKPQSVIDKLIEYYSSYSANIFRGVYKISEKATEEYEKTREIIADFINAKKQEVIFTRNTTESINLIAYSLGRKIIEKNDEIIVSIMEHHANFVPWQVLSSEIGAVLKIIDIDEEGYLRIKNQKSKKINLDEIITKKTKILALTYISNVLGTVNPIKEIIKSARKISPKIIIIIDSAQAVPHIKVDVKDLDADFIAFSSHKMMGPTGVGVLWGKEEILAEMFPFLYGGEMIEEVTIEKTTFKKPPYKFEAGTPSIAEVIGLSEAVKYLKKIGLENIRNHEKNLTQKTIKRLLEEFSDKIKIFGPKNIEDKGGIISFTFDNFHSHDIASILDSENIAVRAGHHCAMPLHQRLGILSTVRASFYVYNDEEDIEKLIIGLKKVYQILKK
ncbi:MAG: SufS family cysteine desulfurase [Patescibacteria group bacterium]|nr:SufS family cysteine desulfurase [Patescibacteria group bacterium]